MAAAGPVNDPAANFDQTSPDTGEPQSGIASAGYDACPELAPVGRGEPARVRVARANGGAPDILVTDQTRPDWRFTVVDLSRTVVDLAVVRATGAGLLDLTEVVLGKVDGLSIDVRCNVVKLIGLLHHLPGDVAKVAILRSLAVRLAADAPLTLAENHQRYAQPATAAGRVRRTLACACRWRRGHQGKPGQDPTQSGPPHSEAAIAALFADAGFGPPTRFFSGLFRGAWIARCDVD